MCAAAQVEIKKKKQNASCSDIKECGIEKHEGCAPSNNPNNLGITGGTPANPSGVNAALLEGMVGGSVEINHPSAKGKLLEGTLSKGGKGY